MFQVFGEITENSFKQKFHVEKFITTKFNENNS